MVQENYCWELGLLVEGIHGILPNMEFDLEFDALGEEFGAEVAGHYMYMYTFFISLFNYG